MVASTNQDFVTYQGDDVSPIFTVKDASGNVVNISTVTDIGWSVLRNDGSSVVLSKSKVGGQITFVTNGNDGQFQVAITKIDTAALSGFYLHIATITDVNGKVTTVAIGRMQVGLKPSWSYDASSIMTSPLYQVRFMVGDTINTDQQMQDEEINFTLSQFSNIYGAAAQCCREIAARYGRHVDTVQGELRILYSQRVKNYLLLANQFQARSLAGAMPYAGGISQADKQFVAQNTDRVPPAFNVMMFDDLLPVAPVGQQTPSAGIPDLIGAGQ